MKLHQNSRRTFRSFRDIIQPHASTDGFPAQHRLKCQLQHRVTKKNHFLLFMNFIPVFSGFCQRIKTFFSTPPAPHCHIIEKCLLTEKQILPFLLRHTHAGTSGTDLFRQKNPSSVTQGLSALPVIGGIQICSCQKYRRYRLPRKTISDIFCQFLIPSTFQQGSHSPAFRFLHLYQHGGRSFIYPDTDRPYRLRFKSEHIYRCCQISLLCRITKSAILSASEITFSCSLSNPA